MSAERRYSATVNGTTVPGSFTTIVEAYNAAKLAIGSGMGGPHKMNDGGKLLEIWDCKNGYFKVSSSRE